jgi:hypothetical protein
MSSYEQHKPDWAFWRVLPAVAPWEAVALSMDVEPRKLLAHPYGGGASGVAVSLIPPLGFSERLELANRCIGSEMLPGVEPLSGTEPTVSLQTFATWAAGVGWPLPEELLRVGCRRTSASLPHGATRQTDKLAPRRGRMSPPP